MRRRGHLLHTLTLLLFLGLLARPDRLLSSVPPHLSDESLDTLAALELPATPSVEETLAPLLEERVYALRGYRRVEGVVKAGESLDGVLRAAGVEPSESLLFARALKPVFDPRRARPGDEYAALLSPEGRIWTFQYTRSPLEVYRASLDPDGWHAERVEIPIERRESVLVGTVEDSLYNSFLRAGADADLVLAFADLFAWDVDFGRETREGDGFRMIYERLYAAGEYVGNGRILAAEYAGERGAYRAVYYHSGKTEGYFDPEGRSVRKSFLRSPLQFTRISSRFSRARRHPVLKIVRPHSGVDYAAPTGTPVWSVADGTVQHAGWKGQAGKTVVIRHVQGYETYYNHLSRIARGMKRGARVTQGQVIGYVGQTGLATGPHLDYRVKKNGRWVDPLKEKYVAGDPVPSSEREAYREWADVWGRRLDGLEDRLRVAQGGGDSE